ncbi:ABC transporter ATP-binding protein [Belliella aquatica]|uniref:ABC transporter ATP-binding protein n=1 Tax=Belliella aquatica TaxID=1323734 RepID=A0ABQ1N9R9_9BACT|nr:ABC transporter ATP-binding protein [Belliella aquatica]MCH7407706.1 ABC transporter ATP-binding protein [Belliella aquatica]GGC55359.1 ABC transporter ATP-binding protein [Belliella aquatica]
MTYLKISSINKSFGEEKPVLMNFSLDIDRGQVISLVGESGSGKSTLLRIIAGLENKNSGDVFLEGEQILSPKEKLVPGYDEIQLVFQEYQLFPNSTVEENIGRPLIRYDKKYKKQRIEELLKLLNLEPFRNKLPRQLSGGQQQKVAIGRALSLEPQVLLLDEPFSSLDTIQRRELIFELKEIFQKLQVTVVFVTHDLDDALQMTDSLVIMHQGKLIQRGSPEDIFEKPKNIYAAKLFSHLNLIPEKPKTYVRPSDVQIFKTTGLPARVIEKQYLVHYNQLTVSLADKSVWKVEDKNRVFEIGDRVKLKWDEKKELSF